MENIDIEKRVLPANIDEQLMYQQVVHTLPMAVYGCDTNGLITFSNPAATGLWGREAIPGQDLWCGSSKIYRPDGTPLPLDECPMAIALKQNRAVEAEEIIIERPDGTRSHVLSHPQPVRNAQGVITGFINPLVDITRRRQDEKVLKELERSNNELTSFSYTASHDLQEPLRKIITFSDKLREQSKDLPENTRESLDKIITSASRMRTLIDDVLNYSRVSNAEKRSAETVDLNGILKNTIADFDHRITEKKAQIIFSSLPTIQACPLQMGQLFHNLLSNALKFSTDEPVITILSKELNTEELKKYPSLAPEKTYMEITFKDNGIGFSKEDSEHIFTIFQRLHGQSQYSGTGIGLALCRKIAENHNGLICAESKGEGAEFYIILPK